MCTIETDIILEKTSIDCPEQYDAYYQGKQVAYLRLRHGHFYVSCPNINGTIVYEAYPNGDGCFDWEERDRYLDDAKVAIAQWLDTDEKG